MMTARILLSSALCSLLLCALAACGTHSSFASTFPNAGAGWSKVLADAKRASPTPQRAVVVGVSEDPRAVFAYDLVEKRLLFRVEAQVTGLPVAAGEFVIVPEATQVTVRRLRDGSVLRELPSNGMNFIGADGDGALTAVVLSTGGVMNARSRLLLMQGERVSCDQKIERGLGRPAVLGGIAFVPHNRVNVSAIAAGGEELARLRVQHDVASYAFAVGNDAYFGQRAMTLLDEKSTGLPVPEDHVLKLTLQHKLPGNPAILPDTNAPPPPPDSALHRVALTFLPQRMASGLGLADDSLYLSYYQLLFGLSPDASQAHWVHTTQSDVVGARAVPGGLVAVESRGIVTLLDTQGRVHGELSLGLKPIAASVRAERLDDLAGAAPEPEAPALQLEHAARNADARMVPARAFAAALLGKVDGDDAARALVSLCSERDLPERLQEAACEALVGRGQSSDAVIAALSVQANFLEGRSAPPITALARAAAHGKDARAVPYLLMQLADPATETEDLAAIIRALARLADASAAAPLAAFVRLYHADVSNEQFETVLTLGMDTLGKLDPARARAVLEPLASDQLARPGVRSGAERALAALGPPPGQEANAQVAAAEPAAAAPAAVSAKAPEGPPVHLTTQHLDEALSPIRVQLSRCVREASDHPASARLVLVINGEGAVVEVKTLPESVRACVAPLVQATTFPATKYGRRSVMSYVVSH